MPINTEIDFQPLRIALVTVSDTRNLAEDRSGDVLAAAITDAGHQLVQRCIVRDEMQEIVALMQSARDDTAVDVLITTGGTGITARDVTPEAFAQVVEKELRGFGEIFRQQGFAKIGTSAIQSRATAGIAGRTIFFVVPGSPSACRDAWGLIVETLDNRYKPCNLSEMLPRMGV